MVKEVVKKRLEGIPENVLQEAQKKMDAYFEEFDMKPWQLKSGREDWRELCYRILGLPAAKNQRKEKRGRQGHSIEFEQKVLNSLADNSLCYNNLEGTALYKKVVQDVAIKPIQKPGGEFSDPIQIVRGIDNRTRKRGLKKPVK